VSEVQGTVREILPRALYRIEMEGGRMIVAHAEAKVTRNFIRLLVGDRVVVALMSKDVTRGRVVRLVRKV
jgi:translation initiation factor IF-1